MQVYVYQAQIKPDILSILSPYPARTCTRLEKSGQTYDIAFTTRKLINNSKFDFQLAIKRHFVLGSGKTLNGYFQSGRSSLSTAGDLNLFFWFNPLPIEKSIITPSS